MLEKDWWDYIDLSLVAATNTQRWKYKICKTLFSNDVVWVKINEKLVTLVFLGMTDFLLMVQIIVCNAGEKKFDDNLWL